MLQHFPLCTELVKVIKSLPKGCYSVGDAAFMLLETLLVPFIGSQKLQQHNDAFNFYMSQMRIRIEMAFGRLVRKFGVLKRIIYITFQKLSWLVHDCIILLLIMIYQRMNRRNRR
mmetsp:Transcript_29069/g.33769  ORF Transcript_29069/g.33769 Transcript_29069/m.33769 type:complete len:115 (+) Transcript_29069:408-752(+)